MTDRELLEAAAKAAGIEGEYWQSEFRNTCGFWVNGRVWNPPTDDGDALRLSVRCRINIRHCGATHICEGYPSRYLADEVDTDGDGMAATRRAIVRAAAAIGAQP